MTLECPGLTLDAWDELVWSCYISEYHQRIPKGISGAKTWFIKDWKVAGALVSPNGITKYS